MDTPPSEVQPFDLQRIFLGDLPWWFTLEVIGRTVVMYVFALALIRLVSKRVVGQLSLIEFLLIIALGSAVGDPMFYADVPLVHCMAVVTVVIFLNRGMLFLVNRSEKIETELEGLPTLLVENGRICVEGLKNALLSEEKLFETLRGRGIEHLGQVRWAYLEQGGELTVFRRAEDSPGLRVVPPWDLEAPDLYEAGSASPLSKLLGCSRCGELIQARASEVLPTCPRCGGTRWADAVNVPDVKN